MYCKTILVGRAVGDAEWKGENRPVTFSLATWENFKDENEESGWRKETTFHDIVIWGNPSIKKYYSEKIQKGQMYIVEGSINVNKWEDEDGNSRKSFRIYSNSIKTFPKTQASDYPQEVASESAKESSDSVDEEDLPF